MKLRQSRFQVGNSMQKWRERKNSLERESLVWFFFFVVVVVLLMYTKIRFHNPCRISGVPDCQLGMLDLNPIIRTQLCTIEIITGEFAIKLTLGHKYKKLYTLG